MTEEDLRAAWRAQPAPLPAATGFGAQPPRTMSWGDLRRAVRRRNFVEVAVAAVLLAVDLYVVVVAVDTLLRVAFALFAIGTLVVIWQIQTRASNLPMTPGVIALPCAEFERRELVRQRDALDSVWLWYVGPIVPGAVVAEWARMAAPDHAGLGWRDALSIGLWVVVLGGVIALNKWGARALQREIDAIDAAA